MTAGEWSLGRRQLYMLPTRHGLWFALALLAMLLAAVNYNNGLAFGLTFLLVGITLASMFDTHHNVSGLRLTAGAPAPVFAGSDCEFPLTLHNDAAAPRTDVWLRCGAAQRRLDLQPRATAATSLPVPAPRRGYLDCPPLSLASHYPFGLCYTWSKPIRTGVRALVYPAPAAPAPFPPAAAARGGGRRQLADGDDFAGLREYRRGDPLRRVHWKTAARGRGWHTKQFADPAAATRWFDWDDLPQPGAEDRLSRLCRWVVDAEAEGSRYGLRLPGRVIGPGRGPAHASRCLEALALWPRADV